MAPTVDAVDASPGTLGVFCILGVPAEDTRSPFSGLYEGY